MCDVSIGSRYTLGYIYVECIYSIQVHPRIQGCRMYQQYQGTLYDTDMQDVSIVSRSILGCRDVGCIYLYREIGWIYSIQAQFMIQRYGMDLQYPGSPQDTDMYRMDLQYPDPPQDTDMYRMDLQYPDPPQDTDMYRMYLQYQGTPYDTDMYRMYLQYPDTQWDSYIQDGFIASRRKLEYRNERCAVLKD